MSSRSTLQEVKVATVQLGGKPIVVVHQPSSDTATAFIAHAGGRTLSFKVSNPEATKLWSEFHRATKIYAGQ